MRTLYVALTQITHELRTANLIAAEALRLQAWDCATINESALKQIQDRLK